MTTGKAPGRYARPTGPFLAGSASVTPDTARTRPEPATRPRALDPLDDPALAAVLPELPELPGVSSPSMATSPPGLVVPELPVLRSVQVLDPLDDPALAAVLPVLPVLRSVQVLDPLDAPALAALPRAPRARECSGPRSPRCRPAGLVPVLPGVFWPSMPAAGLVVAELSGVFWPLDAVALVPVLPALWSVLAGSSFWGFGPWLGGSVSGSDTNLRGCCAAFDVCARVGCFGWGWPV